MQRRTVCLEIRTSCDRCGQSIPLNGPWNEETCSACFSGKRIPDDILGDLLNDFDEDYAGLQEGHGNGGTLMTGSGTYKYGMWRLPPRCAGCRKPLPLPEPLDPGRIVCPECGASCHGFPVPDRLKKEVPSAVYCVTVQPPPGEKGPSGLQVDEGSSRPVVMVCPQCGGSLSVSMESERIMDCGYCRSQVYVPDEVWRRLHPVRKTEEWFVVLEGPTRKQEQRAQRARDEREEQEDLKAWKPKSAPGSVGKRIRPLWFLVAALIPIAAAIGAGLHVEEGEFLPVILIGVAVLISIFVALRAAIPRRTGKAAACGKALEELARKHGWKYEGDEGGYCAGRVRARYRGRDVEIDPADEFAVEVELHDSPFHLRTEPPGSPSDSLRRFTSGDGRIDGLFPIRYAEAGVVERMETSREGMNGALAPLQRFLDRWETKLGRMKVDGSEVGVHLVPGHESPQGFEGRYLAPEDLEPLLEDLMVLAEALDAVGAGRDPDPAEPFANLSP